MEPALKIFGWGSLVLSLLQALLTIAAAATGTPLQRTTPHPADRNRGHHRHSSRGSEAMKRLGFVLVLLLTSCSSALAQEAKPPKLTLPTVVFAAAASADWVTTYRNISHGGDEANPTLRWLGQRPKAVVALGAATDVVGIWAWNRWVGAKHPKLAKVGLYVAAGARFYIAYRNHQRLNEHFRGLR